MARSEYRALTANHADHEAQVDLTAQNPVLSSYYDEYLKSNKIKKARHQHPEIDGVVVESIKNQEIERAMDLRAQLPTVCTSPVVLKRFAEGRINLKEAYERAVDAGADNVPYKKTLAFRKWVTSPEIEDLLDACAPRVRNKLIFELEKISSRIAALHNKYSA